MLSSATLVDAGRLAERLAERLIEPIKILIIVGIAYLLATAGWYLISGPAPAPLTDAKTPGRSAAKSTLSVADIIERNLFGKANATGAAPVVYDAPETRLRLTLEGVFQAEVPEESAAIIAEQGKPGELFLVGGKMPGNATLTEVHADRIVLRRGTVVETLRFSDEPSILTANAHEEPPPIPESGDGIINEAAPDASYETNEAPPPEAPPSADTSSPANLSTVVQSYRDRLQQDPTGTLNALGVAPVSTSGAQGYRVDNLAGSPYLAQTGLQAGDVVLSVNGRPVGDIQTDQAEIDNIVAQGSARLEVQRGSRRFFVTTSLK